MTSMRSLARIAAVVAAIFGLGTAGVSAQEESPQPPAQQGMSPMGGGIMQREQMGKMPMMRMHTHMMKVIFAIADTNGDGAISFQEISAIQKRIFDQIDANKDGKITMEEVTAFMKE
jgi:EF hand domain-containing protein